MFLTHPDGSVWDIKQKSNAKVHIPEHTRSLSGSLLGYKTIP